MDVNASVTCGWLGNIVIMQLVLAASSAGEDEALAPYFNKYNEL